MTAFHYKFIRLAPPGLSSRIIILDQTYHAQRFIFSLFLLIFGLGFVCLTKLASPCILLYRIVKIIEIG